MSVSASVPSAYLHTHKFTSSDREAADNEIELVKGFCMLFRLRLLRAI